MGSKKVSVERQQIPVAQGAVEEGDGVLVAEFEKRTDDAALGAAVTDAFRVDFSESRVLTLVGAATISEGLRRMGRDPGVSLTPAVARAGGTRGHQGHGGRRDLP